MPSQTPPRLAVFDMDGTLLDSLPDLAASADRLLKSYGLPGIAPDLVRAMVGDGVAALVRRLLAHAGEAAAAIDAQQAVDRYMADYTPRSTEQSRLFPGTDYALDTLRTQGWRLAVCTNKPVAAATRIIAALGLEGMFDAIGGGDSFPARKPNPIHLLGTIEQARGTPHRAVMVGDHHNDIAVAEGAGVRAIFARWGYGRPDMEAGATAGGDSITEIPHLAAELIPS
ncbi:phosphoglycolate phosphatase [Gluconacetobacter takamatsuzukensis]|uniref:phosphoglycolate phosphatase n=1 Tax=Gluconacetobacter takamatsuzukensis TaxID=1286190 RepID=A0A7W4PQS3_9PROT|nr:phosphoglycolate phosphatase [Gluconacetobacter takamatsuzukensis]MBB2204819.1 phosphoglycolate phosphatase [Gluconacetobacter takamatsuzukensis]